MGAHLPTRSRSDRLDQAISPDPGLRAPGFKHLEDDRKFYYQELRWRWWHERGVEYQYFWAAPDIPIDGPKSGRMEP